MTDTEAETKTTKTAAATEAREEFTPITTPERLNEIVAEHIARERAKYADYGEFKRKAADLDKAEQRAQEAEARAAKAELAVLRGDIARDHGLPAEALAGGSEEELRAHAAVLVGLFGDRSGPRGPEPDPMQGQTATDTATGGDWLSALMR
ncbi:hypothetical protein [Nocardia transvalensis]|uniref:hypothetical protein n=1 Tax=Nocardia transvalensis TaxID=37333 RepID=UPI0018938E71|nr:hypothetical protein [Nocardia transvalensis]MBF6333438.1 hypothetical protein [Nocardia transvalensis]